MEKDNNNNKKDLFSLQKKAGKQTLVKKVNAFLMCT